MNIFPVEINLRRPSTMNAVIIQLMPNGKRVVSIECVDEDMLETLKEEADRIVWSNSHAR